MTPTTHNPMKCVALVVPVNERKIRRCDNPARTVNGGRTLCDEHRARANRRAREAEGA